MKLGLITYTNLSSGIGLFGWEFMMHLKADSIFSVANKVKGQDTWMERQLTADRPTSQRMSQYLEEYRPDVVLFLETPFCASLFGLARRLGIRTVGIPMHESAASQGLGADLLICVSMEAWRKNQGRPRRLMFLPIGLELFPFKERTGHTFVHNIGYGGAYNRRQTDRVVQAFVQLEDPRARLILRTQAGEWAEGVVVDDPRISYVMKNYPNPCDVYADGDIAIAPQAYGGYERSVLEAMASGLPCLTTDADPMNLFQHNPELLVQPCARHTFSDQWVVNTTYNEVSVEALLEKMRWLLTIDTARYSREARAQAEAQSWESKAIDYKATWFEALRG